jgi:hypothetical protein
MALSASGLLSKYLNKIFVITREIKKGDTVVTPANYDDLGVLLWIVILVGFIVPIATIWFFNPDPDLKKKRFENKEKEHIKTQDKTV